MDVYRQVIERLLIALAEEAEDFKRRRVILPVLNDNTDANTWPPWPWPPWGDDKPDKDKPVNKTLEAHKVAKAVVEFESKLANASLDLWVHASFRVHHIFYI